MIEQALSGRVGPRLSTRAEATTWRPWSWRPQFAGLSRIEQHRLVYAAVQDRLDDGAIHALALKTRAPEER